MTCERVLIVPTNDITKFVQTGRHLGPVPAAKFYVAVTRAAQSVAIVADKPGNSLLPYWEPASPAQQAATADRPNHERLGSLRRFAPPAAAERQR